ncbi:MAG: trehalose-phosphatase [Acidimicrobiales bacterium]|nr:trehalose-phosphatase [Acidimicrobiales bacterium]
MHQEHHENERPAPAATSTSAATGADALAARVAQLARAPQLLVACDYDGTVAPLVDDPMAALPYRETVVAMRSLALLPQTHVAVISGRSLRDLATLSRMPQEIHLVGSHGTEFDIGFDAGLSPETTALRADVETALRSIALRTEGAIVEPKPAAVAFHYRTVAPDAVPACLAEIEAGPGALEGVHVRHLNQVVELALIPTDKGRALEDIRHRVGASTVLYLGDDLTDEDAFATLAGPDVGVKVGDAPTMAEFRVGGTVAVAKVLAQLNEQRAAWLAGAGVVPIEAHSMLSDLRTAAMVAPDAGVVWWCVPRIDSAAVFAELVGGPGAGTFRVGPVGGGPSSGQRYVGDTLVLETSWPGFTVTDYLDCSGGRPGRLAGRSDLIRVLEATDGGGEARATIEFAPRLDFGRYPTRLGRRDDGLEVQGASDLMVLRAPGVEWEIVDDGPHQSARAEVDLRDGPVVLELRCGTANLKAEPTDETNRRLATERFWSDWADGLTAPELAAPMVRRSALVLKGLCHAPTGAILAAPTTSLPEHLGGIRNWDYRYCWLRDAALSAAALVRLGSDDEAMAFLDWVLRILEQRDDPERLHPLYLVTGRHLPPEAEIAELAGYAGSRPVRVGNAAERQVQLDVFGPIVDLVARLVDAGAPLSSQHWRLVEAMVRAVERRWHEPDNGIWEIRKPPRHHVHSKVMCWVTVDRAIAVADHFTDPDQHDWVALRDTIAADVLEHGWKDEVGAFTAAYDGTDLDASVLVIGLSGLLPADDPRFLATVAAVERELRDGPTVYRYRADDGLPGAEGGFHLMTSWLIDALHLVGRTADARALFDGLVALAGPTGLLSEEYDPEQGRSLGNHPQAYSHLGLINNALTLAEP